MKSNRFSSTTAMLVLLGLGLTAALSSGCQSAKFVRTDAAFVEQKKAAPPDVFLDQKPPRTFRTVGIIEVAATVDTPDSDVAADARARAQDVGCDVVVSRTLVDAKASLPVLPWGGRIRLAHGGDDHGGGRGGGEPPQPRPERERTQPGSSNDGVQQDRGVRSGVDRGGALRKVEFICGVYDLGVAASPATL